ncbi:MAG: PilN domain-containing protein [Hyphomicrobiaceae bacterium]|nr:PilN domain-containing protein [Hyphomicrobiaceae bacterium]
MSRVEIMSAATLLHRWLEILARLWLGWQDLRRASHPLLVSQTDGKFVIRHVEKNRPADTGSAKPQRASVLARVTPGTRASAGVRGAARGSQVVLEWPADQIVARRITVPAQARALLAGIVANQIERLSPWPPDQAVHGFAAEEVAGQGTTLDVRVLIGERAAIERTLGELTAIDLPADRVVVQEDGGRNGGPVTLWSRLAHDSKASVRHASRRIGIGLAVIVGLSLCLTLWAMISTWSLRGESESVAVRYKALQRQMQSPSPLTLTSINTPERAWAARESSPSAMIVLEALSRVLPDQAYLTELRLDKDSLRISGLAHDVPSLVAPLEQSGHLANVRFFAPTTLGPDGQHFRFHIEARVEPRLDFKAQ